MIRKNDQILKEVNFYWQEEEYQAKVYQVPEDHKNIDIALLKVINLVNEKFVISLFDNPFATGEELYTFGYPDTNVNGEPGTFEIIGITGDKPPLMKFKEGQVPPGFSGAPLLNLRTGKVCGIINKTLDRSSDLGGKGVPVSVIFNNFPELLPKKIEPNPFKYLTGRIDDPKLVFGREKEVKRIFELLNIGSSVAVIGEREIGKSSLLRVIEDQAESKLESPRKPIYLNLGEVYDEDDFYFFLCDLIGIPECKGFRLSRELKKHQLLLILDNVEKMAWDGFTNQIRSQIRALAEGNNAPLRLVIAAERPLSQLFNDSGMVSPFENVCIEEPISSWDEQTIREFINYHLQNTSISFTEAEIRQIISDTKGHPKKVMNLCYQIYNSYLQSSNVN